MATTVTFVDHSFLDRKARRSFRSHVLKGKNGAKMRALKRPPHAATPDDDERTASHMGARQYSHDALPDLYSPPSSTFSARPRPGPSMKPIVQVGGELASVSSPCAMTAQSRRTIRDFLCYCGDAAYAQGSCSNRPDPNLSLWFQYMLIDEAFFHCFAALSEACMDYVTGKQNQSAEYRLHMVRAMRLINDKLSSTNAVADTNMAGVIALCLLSSVREQPLQTKIHFDGLCRMIELRGGMDELVNIPALIEKTRRIDIDLALQLGGATKLGRSAKTLDAIVPIFSSPAFEVRSPLINAVRNADLKVFAAAQDTMKVNRLFNSGVAAKKLGAHAFQDLITTTCYRLLEIRPIGASRSDMHPVANTVHLALISFMTTFLVQIGRQRRPRYELLARKFMKALDNPKFRAAVDPATHLWLLVIAGVSVFNKDDRVWLQPRLSEAAEQFGCTDWTFARRLLGKYPWIGDLHDQPASEIWASCFPSVHDE